MRLLPRMLVAMIVLVAGGVAWVGWKVTPWGQLPYVEDRTGIDLPPFPSSLFVYDDAEMSITVHAVLQPDYVVKALATRAFRAGDRELHARPWLPSDLFRAAELPEAYRQLPPGAHIHRAQGCGGGTSWIALLDDVSGAIWIEVMYPDWSGDEPPCG